MKLSKERLALIAGMIGCLLYVIGDFLFAAIGKNQSAESIGLMVKVAYLDMICGVVGTALYYVGFHQMWKLLKRHLTQPKQQKWVKMFQIAYLTGTVCWGYVHAMFMNVALIFKFTFEKYGDMQAAAEIANKVFYCRAHAGGVSSVRRAAERRDARADLEGSAPAENDGAADTGIPLQSHRLCRDRGEPVHAFAVAARSDRSRHGVRRASAGHGAWAGSPAGNGEKRRM